MDSRTQSPTLRLKPEDVQKNWNNGYYTTKGYLAHLLLSMKRAGWAVRIDCVKSFCAEWGIKRASFYRAKSELILDGILVETIHGRVDLTMRSDTPVAAEELIDDDSSQSLEPTQVELADAQVELADAQVLQSSLNPTQQFDDRMRGLLQPWQASVRRNDYIPEFVAYIKDIYLPSTPMYEGKSVTVHHAKAWISKRVFCEEGLSLTEIQWDAYQDSLKTNPVTVEADRERKYQIQLARARANGAAKEAYCADFDTIGEGQRSWGNLTDETRESLWRPFYIEPVEVAD